MATGDYKSDTTGTYQPFPYGNYYPYPYYPVVYYNNFGRRKITEEFDAYGRMVKRTIEENF